MSNDIESDGFFKTVRKVMRVSNGRVESRSIRDFYDSPLEAGDMVDLYRAKKRQFIEVFPGDLIVRKAGSHPIV